MEISGRLKIVRRRDNFPLVDVPGIFTYNMRKLFLLIAMNFSSDYETVSVKDIYGSSVDVYARQSVYSPSFCIVYNQINSSVDLQTGLRAGIGYTSSRKYGDAYDVEGVLLYVNLASKVHREQVIAHLISYAGTLEIQNDITINTVYIVNRILSTACQPVDILVDVFQFSDVELKSGEKYDSVYSIAFT